MPATSEHQFHLIVSIVNNGFFEHAMEAARKRGRREDIDSRRGLGSKKPSVPGHHYRTGKDLILIVAPRRKSGPSGRHHQSCWAYHSRQRHLFPAINHLSGFGAGIDNIDQI